MDGIVVQVGGKYWFYIDWRTGMAAMGGRWVARVMESQRVRVSRENHYDHNHDGE